MKPKTTMESVAILPISQGEVRFHIVGTSPLYFNRIQEKAKRELLLPHGRMNDAAKAANQKHDPVAEFRGSVYRHPGNGFPTRLKFPADGFKGALRTAALDMPGAKKAEVGRLVTPSTWNIDIYGIPLLSMDPVTNSGIVRSRDIRTRAVLDEWAAALTIRFVQPKLTAMAIVNLVNAAGVTCGIGDWRQEKGSGSNGLWRVCETPDDPDFRRIVQAGGLKAQDEALLHYHCLNDESAELLDWLSAEILRLKGQPAKPKGIRGKRSEAA